MYSRGRGDCDLAFQKRNPPTSVRERQRGFGAAVLNPGSPIPAGLVGPDGEPSVRRFAVYRNNVVVGLIDALSDAFPVVRRVVGDDFFLAMAGVFVRQTPPSGPVMLEYGGEFPAFIDGFAPAADLPYLCDLARLERAWCEAHQASEASPLDVAELRSVAPAALAGTRLRFHPSLRIVRSPFPIFTIWNTNVEGATPVPIDIGSGGEDVLIVRPGSEVEARRLPAGAALFIEALSAHDTIVEAAEAGARSDPDFDLSRSITGILEARAIVSYAIESAIREREVS